MDKTKIIDGKMVSELIKAKVTTEVIEIKKKNHRVPSLTIIQIGNNKASSTYIKNKKIACEKVGIICNVLTYPEAMTESDLLNLINQLNQDSTIDAILVQLPLPMHINSEKIINSITITKDVDGFTPQILGNLMLGHYQLLPGTPKGIMFLLKHYQIELKGQHVVVIGRSNIVGKPLANLLINASATVTVCHSQTKNLSFFTKQADILISAVGQPKMITSEMIKENAIIIDVGINRDQDNKLCGDVDFENVLSKVKMITPVPGGVGPMTIAALLENILYLYYQNNNL
ncbi:bifunctional 5,10-methylenetetrahydrofolate dehydrogenase/5,10-methenyltetrahydrofolate cyclohydrolase [Spiroplasma sp. SV19]|uniref:bifunctional 5,10-methylenetetrahydrofolate dehydrogenase/5,10-methenyltetrahydrofolate cyclohydrolase n=1 Tax=Spiroplasma sp. SV19 TaxID=2570468 RepID=UPI0024B71721|nr:bifunctional 5,10-methylenetetrahydrofolate dehydrogenase/5,10-methenyltetrahydrofolate cyclohydrolase [Spiroplasma sp. SV19]WHQ36428.1 bifunctional methylenetetrahydrofolate dehydrogenase/methenyltetrahydrofolate cyclohydrolase [Spiroplasma sp. SV19]